MTIEVKQMIIKSTIINDQSRQDDESQSLVDIEQLKEMLIEECRELIAESLAEMQER